MPTIAADKSMLSKWKTLSHNLSMRCLCRGSKCRWNRRYKYLDRNLEAWKISDLKDGSGDVGTSVRCAHWHHLNCCTKV